TSISRRSGLTSFTSSTACLPSRASPTISSVGSFRSMAFIPSTKRVWSSQIRMRVLFTSFSQNREERTNRTRGPAPAASHAKFYPEAAAAPRLRLDANAAAHQFHGLTNRRQSQSDAGKILFRVESDERQKNALLVFFGYSYAVVVNGDPAQ